MGKDLGKILEASAWTTMTVLALDQILFPLVSGGESLTRIIGLDNVTSFLDSKYWVNETVGGLVSGVYLTSKYTINDMASKIFYI